MLYGNDRWRINLIKKLYGCYATHLLLIPPFFRCSVVRYSERSPLTFHNKNLILFYIAYKAGGVFNISYSSSGRFTFCVLIRRVLLFWQCFRFLLLRSHHNSKRPYLQISWTWNIEISTHAKNICLVYFSLHGIVYIIWKLKNRRYNRDCQKKMFQTRLYFERRVKKD